MFTLEHSKCDDHSVLPLYMGIEGWGGPEGKGLHLFFKLAQNKATAGLWWAPSRRAIVLRISIFPITPRVIETFEVGCRKRPYLRDAEGGGPRRTQGDIEVGLYTSCSCLFATSLFLQKGERLMVLFPRWLFLLYSPKAKRERVRLYDSTVRVKRSVHLHPR